LKFFLINKDTSEVFELQDQMTFGRRPNCDVIFKDDLVSGFHCKFHQIEDGYEIEDLGASNPVQINGIQIDENQRKNLKHNNVLSIGACSFLFTDKEKLDETSYKTFIIQADDIKNHLNDFCEKKFNKSFISSDLKKRQELKSIQSRIDIISSTKSILDELHVREKELQVSKEKASVDLESPGSVDLSELKDKIIKLNEQISELSKHRDNLVKQYNGEKKYQKINAAHIEVLSELDELNSEEIESEFKELQEKLNKIA